MQSQHWTNFTPNAAGIDNVFGGINSTTVDNGVTFAAITYRIFVDQAHAGWHHKAVLFSHLTGNFTDPDSNNIVVNEQDASSGLIKEACEPGFYQFLLHFHLPQLRGNNAGGNNTIPWRFNIAEISGTDGSGKKRDLMVIQPLLVDPTDYTNTINLWEQSYPGLYAGWQDITGIPVMTPGEASPY